MDWVEQEIEYLTKEQAGRISKDTTFMMKMILMMVVVFFCGDVEASRSRHDVCANIEAVPGGGQTFRCQHCGARQWQAEKNADYSGAFYCASCRKRL